MTLSDTDLPSYWQNAGPAAPDPLDAAFTADWLMEQTFPPTEYVVPGLIPEGATLLVAAPKIGKSWMVLGIAIAAAGGGHVFDALQLDPRPVLYLALEDGPRRLQSRMRILGAQAPADLTLMTTLDAPADTTMAAFLERNAARKPLVILDTLGKVRGTYGGNDPYGNDYGQMSALKGLVDAHPGSSLIVVHHTNKGAKADFLESVNGTQGLAGAVDSILALKRERNSEQATLSVTSREAMEGEYALTMRDGAWILEGGDLAAARAAAESAERTSNIGDLTGEVLAAVNDAPNGTDPKGVAALVEGLKGDNNMAGTYLRRLVDKGFIRKDGRGKYLPIPTGDVFPDFE